MMHYALQRCKRLLRHECNYLNPMDQIEIGKRLARARLEAGFIHAKDAAISMGVSVSSYIQHENGRRGFRYPTAQKYARKFKVNPDWLLTGVGDQRPPDPTEEELELMLRIALDEVLTLSTKTSDLPRIVAPALHVQLEQYRAGELVRYDQDFQIAASVREGRAQSREPTKRAEREESRNS